MPIPQPVNTSPARPKGLVIVPAFNEGDSLPTLMESVIRLLPDWDYLIVDDGSTDSTAEFTATRTRVIHLPFNLGIGGAVQAGYRYAQQHGYELAVQLDGDGQHRPEDVSLLLEKYTATKADMVIGSRFLEPGRYSQSAIRSLGTMLIRSELSALTGKRFTDCASGFRLINRKVIGMFAHWYPDDYPEPEVLLHLHRAGCAVVEVPVTMKPRLSGRSSISLTLGCMYVAKVSLALFLALLRRPWPERLSANGRDRNHPTTNGPST